MYRYRYSFADFNSNLELSQTDYMYLHVDLLVHWLKSRLRGSRSTCTGRYLARKRSDLTPILCLGDGGRLNNE